MGYMYVEHVMHNITLKALYVPKYINNFISLIYLQSSPSVCRLYHVCMCMMASEMERKETNWKGLVGNAQTDTTPHYFYTAKKRGNPK